MIVLKFPGGSWEEIGIFRGIIWIWFLSKYLYIVWRRSGDNWRIWKTSFALAFNGILSYSDIIDCVWIVNMFEDELDNKFVSNAKSSCVSPFPILLDISFFRDRSIKVILFVCRWPISQFTFEMYHAVTQWIWFFDIVFMISHHN